MENPPKPYPALWFPDGSVVLKTDSYLFRVHKSILARESSVFKDMFAFPATKDDDLADEYEGLPVVPLLGDDEKDVIQLLKMLYKPTFGAFKDTLLKMSRAVGLFKLSNKYHFSGVDSTIQNELHVAFSPTLDAFRRRQGCRIRRSLHSHQNILPLLPMVQATENVKKFPSLFYCCSQYSISAILAEDLPPETTELLLNGREQVKQSIHNAFSEKIEEFKSGVAGCKIAPNYCQISACLAEFNSTCQNQSESSANYTEEFFTMKELDEVDTTIELCAICRNVIVEEVLPAVREEVWEQLPEIFELDT